MAYSGSFMFPYTASGLTEPKSNQPARTPLRYAIFTLVLGKVLTMSLKAPCINIPLSQGGMYLFGGRHQAIGPYLDAGLDGLLGQEVAVYLVIAVLEEDRLAPVAALGDMVRQTRDDDAGETRHA